MRDAAVQGRAERALAIIEEIKSVQPEAAKALAALVADFRFDELMAITEVGPE